MTLQELMQLKVNKAIDEDQALEIKGSPSLYLYIKRDDFKLFTSIERNLLILYFLDYDSPISGRFYLKVDSELDIVSELELKLIEILNDRLDYCGGSVSFTDTGINLNFETI